MKKEAVILYSGGLDSSAVACIYADQGYNRLELLTFDNGTQGHLELSKVKIPELKKKFPDTEINHQILSSKYLFKKMTLEKIEEDSKKYSSNLLCVGCKISMHSEAIIYALNNGIYLIADGFAERQSEFPEQDISFIKEMKKFQNSFGINYECPLYHTVKNKSDVKDLLLMYDMSPKSIEPDCMMGGSFTQGKTEEIKDYVQDKLINFARDYIIDRIKIPILEKISQNGK
jgi:7-cyano-7-deazaguanine synthase in queuosine biosynthesis